MAERALRDIPPIRRDFLAEDPADSERLAWMEGLWDSQDNLLASRNRQVEENVRMLAGQQWSFWEPATNRFVDVTDFMDADERRWRQLPVVNMLLPWFMLTHSRLTENPPIVTFQPSSADDLDAQLAEIWDVIHKTMWRELEMEEANDRLMAWLIAGGRAYVKTRVDPSAGDLIPAPSVEQMDPELMALTPGTDQSIPMMPEGGLAVDVLSAPEVRSEWGPQPFHKKRWHMQRSYLSPERVFEAFGIEVEGDTSRTEIGTDLHSLLFGAGWYGGASRSVQASGMSGSKEEELVEVDELWMAPNEQVDGMEENQVSPGGRLMIRAGEKILRDGPRPARFEYTSPLRSFDFVGVPGRPEGSSPQEMLNPIQRAYNRLFGQVLEYANLVSNPKPLIHQSVGLEEWSNKPGEPIVAGWGAGIDKPVSYLDPPALGSDVYEALEMLERKFEQLGSMRGAESRLPESGISGESVKELRFNADRPISATAKRSALEYARWSSDLRAWLAVLWDEERVVEYAGEDNIMRTVQVSPRIWSGKIDAFPDTESMLPEGRGARQERADQLYDRGLFGPPDSPEARRTFLEYAHFPHLGRDVQPGAVHRRTAQRAMASVVKGAPADDVHLFRWYNFEVWRGEMEDFMSSPEYLKLEPGPMGQMALLYEMVIQAAQAQALEEIHQQAVLQNEAVEAVTPSAAEASESNGARAREERP